MRRRFVKISVITDGLQKIGENGDFCSHKAVSEVRRKTYRMATYIDVAMRGRKEARSVVKSVIEGRRWLGREFTLLPERKTFCIQFCD